MQQSMLTWAHCFFLLAAVMGTLALLDTQLILDSKNEGDETWESRAVKDNQFIYPPVQFSASASATTITYGDLFPWLSVAIGLAKRQVPVFVTMFMPQGQGDFFEPVKKIMNSKMGNMIDHQEEPNIFKPIFGQTTHGLWFPESQSYPGYVAIMVFKGSTGDQNVDVVRRMNNAVRGGKPKRTVWVGMGVDDPHESAHPCPTCQQHSSSIYEAWKQRQDHILVSMITGDTGMAGGSIVLNMRSSILFPDANQKDSELAPFPNPLGMVMLKHEPALLNGPFGGLLRWMQEQKENTVICVTFGSFAADVKKYMEVWKKLAQEKDVRLLLQVGKNQVNDVNSTIQTVNPPNQPYIHEGFMPNFDVFKSCSTVVHTGGAGTVTEAMYLGKPQVILYHSVGTDKSHNAKMIGVQTARECSGQIGQEGGGRTKSCEALRDMLGLQATLNTPADLLAKFILVAPDYQANYTKNHQHATQAEMGNIESMDSMALRIGIDEIHRLWTNASSYKYSGMPTVVFNSTKYTTSYSLERFATDLANLTDGAVMFIGAGVSEARIGCESNLCWFKDADAMERYIIKHQYHPWGKYAKLGVVACEKYAQDFDDNHPWVLQQFVFHQACAKDWVRKGRCIQLSVEGEDEGGQADFYKMMAYIHFDSGKFGLNLLNAIYYPEYDCSN